jgi:multicomponent Na+:H+ antiporter subunit G
MSEIITSILMLLGAGFLLLAAVGIVRMPDLFTRMQPATKAATLGITCMLLAVAVHFGRIGTTTRALAAIAFFFLTAPVTAHLIGRASYFVGVPLWKDTVIDELRGKYDPLTHRCESRPVVTIVGDRIEAQRVDRSLTEQ